MAAPVAATPPRATTPTPKPRVQKKAAPPTPSLPEDVPPPPTGWQAGVADLPEEDPDILARRKQNELDDRFEEYQQANPYPNIPLFSRQRWDRDRERAEARRQTYNMLQALPSEDRDIIVRQLPQSVSGYGKGGWLKSLPFLSEERARTLMGDTTPDADQGGWIGLEANRPEEDQLREAKPKLQTIVGE